MFRGSAISHVLEPYGSMLSTSLAGSPVQLHSATTAFRLLLIAPSVAPYAVQKIHYRNRGSR